MNNPGFPNFPQQNPDQIPVNNPNQTYNPPSNFQQIQTPQNQIQFSPPIHNQNSIQRQNFNTIQNKNIPNNSPNFSLNNFQQTIRLPPVNSNFLPNFQNKLPNNTFQNALNSIQSNPFLLEFFRRISSTPQNLQNFPKSIPILQNNPIQNSDRPQKKRGRPKKIETEFRVRIPKQKKKEPKEPSGDNFESFADDYIPKDLEATRAVVRENRKQINYNEDDEDSDELDDDFNQMIQTPKEEAPKIERIIASRKCNGQTNFLVKFQNSPSQALCQWITEAVIQTHSNYKSLLQRFNLTPLEIPDDSPLLSIVAHRYTATGYIFLYKYIFEPNTIFFWDAANENAARNYFQKRIQVILCNPPLPTSALPIPTTRTIVSTDNQEMREYQLDGLKWLLQCWMAGHGSILADEMGLGKTIQILSFLSYLNKYTQWHGPFLITVRTNCFKQWCDEIERWTDLKYIAYNSGPAARALLRDYVFPALDNYGNPIPNSISFNILLVSYDVLLKDINYLNKNYLWEVLVADEGHRIKNSAGKKNEAMSNLRVKQRIILTGTPIQNTLTELWTLLRFVSPSFFQDTPAWLESDVDSLSPETVLEARNKISPHLLRRSLVEVERSIAPKEERVAFITLTQVQKDMIRLIKLHKLWRIKGVQVSEQVEIDTAHETNAIQKVCSHPFLVDGAEEYYTKKFEHLDRLQLILACSSKFQWLDKVLANFYAAGHKILIFSQRVKLLRLLQEYCGLKGYACQLLIGQMTETEKTQAIATFSAEDSNDFIFLISTRAGSEGLNLTVANTTIIFDPDWNPQNDLQALGRCHRIGQTQKVDVLRLITYQTYEHEMFVRAQRKLGLWLTLLGSKTVEPSENVSDITLEEPPQIPEDLDPTEMSLNELLSHISTVITDFSLPTLDKLEEPLNLPIDYSDGTPDEVFIETFPVEVDDGSSRRAKRSRSRDLMIDSTAAQMIYNKLKKFGYGHIDSIADTLSDFSKEQIDSFAINIIVFAFRALPPQQLSYFPVLIHRVLTDYPDFTFNMLMCANKHHWTDINENEQELDVDVQSIVFLKDELFEHALTFLSILEMKLIASVWISMNNLFPFDKIAPVISDKDEEIFNSLSSNEEFDPFSDRMMVIINYMRSDLILTHQESTIAQHFPFWTEPEFFAVFNALKNIPLSSEDHLYFHSKTGLLTKTTTEVFGFAMLIKRKCMNRNKGPITIPNGVHKLDDAPYAISSLKLSRAWTTISSTFCDDLKLRLELLDYIKLRVHQLMEQNSEMDDDIAGIEWNDQKELKLFQLIIEYGFDSLHQILIDPRFGFLRLLSISDIHFLRDGKPRKYNGSSEVPDYFFNENDLKRYLVRTVKNGGFEIDQDDSDDDFRVVFVPPRIKKLDFFVNSVHRPKKKSNDNGSYNPHRARNQNKKKIIDLSESEDDDNDDDSLDSD